MFASRHQRERHVFGDHNVSDRPLPPGPNLDFTLAAKKTTLPERMGKMLFTQPPVCELSLRIEQYTSRYTANNWLQFEMTQG